MPKHQIAGHPTFPLRLGFVTCGGETKPGLRQSSARSAAGWGWPTARAVILSRPHVKSLSTGLDNAFSNFERLSPTTAQRVMRFWQARTTAAPEIRYT